MELTMDGHIKASGFPAGPAGRYEVLKELGDRYAAVRCHPQARRCYQQASAIAPDRPEPHLALGAIALQTDDLVEAMKCLGFAAALDPRCTEAYGGLAMVHQRRGDYSAAFDMYLKCLELDGDNLVALLGLFQTSRQMGSFAKIIYFLERYLAKHPGDASVLFCLATLHARDGELLKARDDLQAVLAAEPDRVEAAWMLQQIDQAIAEGQHREAATA
jgi:tetratricopeptide (TPR) repeat protein